MTPRLCPNCDVALQPVTGRAASGYLLLLDQCSRCGGIWFDRWELFPLDAVEVDRLDPLDQSALQEPVADVKRELKCPKCHKPLQRFRDALLPDDARIERCNACEGMWLNRGELRRFKSRRRKAAAVPRPLADAPLRQLTENYARSASWPTVANLDGATSASVSPVEEVEELKSGVAWGAAWLGLRLLLRLLLGV